MFKTHRFLLDKTFVDVLTEFSKKHQFVDRKTFKEEWKSWIIDPEIQSLIDHETERLLKEGYKGDIIDKMFKSARFYLRTKPLIKDETKKQRKEYEGFSKEVLSMIDLHIQEEIENQNNITKDNRISISPEEGFSRFYTDHKEMIAREIGKTNNISSKTTEDILHRFKKTYKNRFYKKRIVMEKETNTNSA
jgi:hypothetical protein